MKLKTAAGSLTVMFLIAAMIVSPAYAETPKYNATGTWDYQITKGWANCAGSSVHDISGTVTITQSGNSISIYEAAEMQTTYGTVDGDRYRFTRWEPDDGGMQNEQGIWTLQSSVLGSGHFLGSWSDGQSYCNYGAIFICRTLKP